LLQVTHSIKFEKEFLVDHDLFLALGDIIPEIGEVRLDMKRGAHHSEFSMFRYDAYFWRKDPEHPRSQMTYDLVPYAANRHSIPQLRDLLSREAPMLFALAKVPDARTAAEGQLVKLLKGSDDATMTCGGLRKASAEAAAALGPLEPEELYCLGEELGYHVEMMWSPDVRITPVPCFCPA
jgi:hypothetical protein